MDAKGCEVMAVSSAFVDDGAHNALRASSARRDQLCLAGEVIARSRCVWALSRSHQPVRDCGRSPPTIANRLMAPAEGPHTAGASDHLPLQANVHPSWT